ncbi:P-loop NTPase family protein [Comamonas composti]|uniref:toxin n=1 Tax=Comamonas composti TaxID=408558 RepID=UPI0004040B74|nr:toxin [Comamonas composti]
MASAPPATTPAVRALVIGTSGSGKTRLAQDLAAGLGCTHIELDAHHWGPDWAMVPTEQFRASVARALEEEGGKSWVADGNYSAVRDLLWPQASHVIWLNYGRATIFPRVLWRTVSRAFLDTTLWHGNRESLRMAFFSRDSILLWSWNSFQRNRSRYAALRESGEYPHLQWLELTHPSQAKALIQALTTGSSIQKI